MSAVLIYVFPAVMDMVLASVLFLTTVWAAQNGASPSQVANLITAWSVVYMVVCPGYWPSGHETQRRLVAHHGMHHDCRSINLIHVRSGSVDDVRLGCSSWASRWLFSSRLFRFS